MLLNKRISVSYFLSQIKTDLIILTIYAVVIGILDDYSWFRSVNISLSVTATLGIAISLLLAFRTNQSYERWWEARTIWGAVVNESRTLVRQAKAFIKADDGALADAIAARQVIWVHALGQYLRRTPYSIRVKEYEKEHHIEADHFPNVLLSLHSEDIQQALEKRIINSFQQVQLDSTVVKLCDALGKCERIKNTVFPKSYSLLIHFIIYVFATMLPFGLNDDNHLIEILLTIIIPSIFICIEKTSILMQDPFENKPLDTPMTALAETIERNIVEMTGKKELPPKPSTDNYYQL